MSRASDYREQAEVLSSPSLMRSLPTYDALGVEDIQDLISELREHRSMCLVVALRDVTGEDLALGKSLDDMVAAWLAWAEKE